MLNEVIRVRYYSNRTGVLMRRRNTRACSLTPFTCIKERPYEDTARRWSSATQEESPYQTPTLLMP